MGPESEKNIFKKEIWITSTSKLDPERQKVLGERITQATAGYLISAMKFG